MTEAKRSHQKKPASAWGKAKGPAQPIFTFNSLSQASADRRVFEATPSFQKHKALCDRIDAVLATLPK